MKKNNSEALVFTAFITLRNGHRLYARQVGKRVFCFPRKEACAKGEK